jgi:uridine kinase
MARPTDLPKFDFQKGGRVVGRRVQLGPEEPIIIEGIHALNDKLTTAIPPSAKFKIFIAPQAQINLDDHNPLSLTDLRLAPPLGPRQEIPRLARRRNLSRCGRKSGRGEFKWIYPNQEGSDYVFNSFMPYELPVMKKYAMPLLGAIDKESPYYPDAERLRMLKFFKDMQDEWIPSNSLMREFIGGSCYADV